MIKLKGSLLAFIIVMNASCSNQTFPEYTKCRQKCVNNDFLCSYSIADKVSIVNNFFFCKGLSESCYRDCRKKAHKRTNTGSSGSGGGGGGRSSSSSGGSGGGSGGSSHEILSFDD